MKKEKRAYKGFFLAPGLKKELEAMRWERHIESMSETIRRCIVAGLEVLKAKKVKVAKGKKVKE